MHYLDIIILLVLRDFIQQIFYALSLPVPVNNDVVLCGLFLFSELGRGFAGSANSGRICGHGVSSSRCSHGERADYEGN